MNVEFFKKEEHLPLINGWAKDRGLCEIDDSMIPRVGFMAVKDQPVASLFLYQTDSKIAFVDNLISDKKASAEDRKEAILKLLKCAVEMCEHLEFKHLLTGGVQRQGVKSRLAESGFEISSDFVSLFKRSI